MSATPSTAQDSTQAIRHAARCPRCGDVKQHGDLLCDACYRVEPFYCQRCGEVEYLLSGLCATCHADELGADVDADAAIPYTLTAQGLAALAGPPLSGEACCPHCGRLRGVVYDGESTRCFGCHRHWTPQADRDPIVA